ncbi:MAG TPA: FeS-binding protein [Candidatus Rokubacteria bacterium]|nr:FeS-binding protein [Candidatus Rokubacteria bacterium]
MAAMARMRVRLTFPAHLIQEPIVYRLVKDFDIVINIRRADVKADHGWMALELDGDEAALERGVRWLKEAGVQVDPLERDVMLP